MMRKWLAVMAALGMAAGTAAARTPKQYTIAQFLDTVSMTGASFSSDEKAILVSANKTGIYNAYRIPVEGGAMEAVTHSPRDTTFALTYFPRDGRVLFSRDQGGNERSHIYLLSPDGSERDLTPGASTKAEFVDWSRDERAFYYLSNARDPKYFDVFRMEADKLEPERVYEDSTGYNFGGISGDGRYLAFSKPKTTSDSDIFLFDTKTHEMKAVTPHTGSVLNRPETFDPQSKYLYYLSNDGSDFLYLARLELATGRREKVIERKWDVEFARFSHNGKYMAVGVNEDARTKVELYEEPGGKKVDLPAMPEGQITSVRFSRSEKMMAFYFNGDRSPGNLYVYDFAQGEARKLTDNMNPAIDPADLVDSKVVRYPSFDRMEIPAILYRPQEAEGEHKAPALVWVHGGPGGQTTTGYSAVIQYYVNHGYAILGVNNRGSSGYGQKFYMADDRKHGHEPLWDCVEAKKYLAGLGWVDPERIGIMGGSYGGYMTLAALTLQPKAFTVGVDLFGISNWVRTLESIPPWWEAQREALYQEIGDPKKDREMLMEVSPLFHVDRIERPLMILQGANDPRVIKAESDDMVAAVKKKGGIVEYVVFPDEGHGFKKRKNQIEGYGAVLQFLDKYLKGVGGG